MDINSLRIFYAVVTNGGVVKAAQALSISQPAVSNALKRFQQKNKINFFHKKGRSLQLTEVGERLYELANKLFSAEHEIDQFINNIKIKEDKSIRVGLVTIFERFESAAFLHSIRNLYSDYNIVISSGNSVSLLKELLLKKIDMALIGDHVKDKDIIFSPYKKYNISLIVHRDNPLAYNDKFLPQDLEGEQVVLKETGSAIRFAVDSYLKKFNISLDIISELSNFEGILNYASQNKCLTFLPDYVINKLNFQKDFKKLTPATDEKIEFSIGFAFNKQYDNHIDIDKIIKLM